MRLKSLLLCFLMLACVGITTAQTRLFSNPSNVDERTDTVANTGTTYFKASTNGAGPLSVMFIGTKVSGTISGTAYLEASIDPLSTVYSTIDSLVLGNVATNSLLRTYANNVYSRYQWRVVTAGTMAFTVRSYYNR